MLLIIPRSGELWTQKLKSQLLKTQSLKVLPISPDVNPTGWLGSKHQPTN